MADDVSRPDPSPARSSAPHEPYGPATAAVRRYLVALSALSSRDWLVLTHDYRRRAGDAELRRADAALGRAVERGNLQPARDAVVGPVLQLAQRVAAAPDGAAEASGLGVDDLAEAALAGALALVAAPLLAPRETAALYAHLEPLVPRASLG